jgi:membrane carboxypeptidase/penicillin-binding protein
VAHRFGITSEIPPFLPIAIGAADITLAEQVGAYTVFPNDGIRIQPHYIRKVTQPDGVPLDAKKPTVTEVISVDVARSMMILLKAVVTHGTGAQATVELKHPLGGKTGTTNDFTDAWFIGFSPSVTCGTWIGFDNRQTLGKGEQGARTMRPSQARALRRRCWPCRSMLTRIPAIRRRSLPMRMLIQTRLIRTQSPSRVRRLCVSLLRRMHPYPARPLPVRR